jgi:hypothetical protein
MPANLIERYVHEVGRRLPRKMRADVETELRSLLTDSLRGRTGGKEPPDAAAMEAGQAAVLKAFGPPEKTAARYAPPHRYLIGPNLYDPYCAALLAAGIGVTALVLLLLGLSLLGGDEAVLPELLDFAGVYIRWMVTGFGVITLAFAAVERLLPEDSAAGEKESGWDPRTLPDIHDPSRIGIGGLVFEIVCIGAALVVFNFFPDWIGLNFGGYVGEHSMRWYSVPLLSDYFYGHYLPLWNVNFVLTILLNTVLLRRGRWEGATRILDFGLSLFGIGLLAAMLAGPSLVDIRFAPDESLRDLMQPVFSGLIPAVLAVALVATAIGAVGKLVKILRLRTGGTPG